ncbi:hypothetical protein PUN28_004446 [Cardiocondyla obscurior]|uniref:Uncharacterized protein n=1 Tax=Cardiocondyla obscurior TaxID=286306 RepID=A0AAW2GFW5_9HYME
MRILNSYHLYQHSAASIRRSHVFFYSIYFNYKHFGNSAKYIGALFFHIKILKRDHRLNSTTPLMLMQIGESHVFFFLFVRTTVDFISDIARSITKLLIKKPFFPDYAQERTDLTWINSVSTLRANVYPRNLENESNPRKSIKKMARREFISTELLCLPAIRKRDSQPCRFPNPATIRTGSRKIPVTNAEQRRAKENLCICIWHVQQTFEVEKNDLIHYDASITKLFLHGYEIARSVRGR